MRVKQAQLTLGSSFFLNASLWAMQSARLHPVAADTASQSSQSCMPPQSPFRSLQANPKKVSPGAFDQGSQSSACSHGLCDHHPDGHTRSVVPKSFMRTRRKQQVLGLTLLRESKPMQEPMLVL